MKGPHLFILLFGLEFSNLSFLTVNKKDTVIIIILYFFRVKIQNIINYHSNLSFDLLFCQIILLAPEELLSLVIKRMKLSNLKSWSHVASHLSSTENAEINHK